MIFSKPSYNQIWKNKIHNKIHFKIIKCKKFLWIQIIIVMMIIMMIKNKFD